MRKKIFTLLLAVSLMMSFTVSGFADTGDYEILNLGPENPDDTLYLFASDMESNDDDLFIGVSLETRNFDPKYTIEVFDRDLSTTDPIISFTSTEKTAYFIYDNVIDYTHDYKIVITNIGGCRIRGHITAIIK